MLLDINSSSIYYLITINYIVIPKLILNVSSQIFNKINGIRQFRLNKVPTGNVTQTADMDILARFPRASFPLDVGNLFRLVTKMRKIRVRKIKNNKVL